MHQGTAAMHSEPRQRFANSTTYRIGRSVGGGGLRRFPSEPHPERHSVHVGIPLPRISPEAPFRSVLDPHPDFHLTDLAGTTLRHGVLKANQPTCALRHTMCDDTSQHLMQFQDSANEPSGKLAMIACIAGA